MCADQSNHATSQQNRRGQKKSPQKTSIKKKQRQKKSQTGSANRVKKQKLLSTKTPSSVTTSSSSSSIQPPQSSVNYASAPLLDQLIPRRPAVTGSCQQSPPSNVTKKGGVKKAKPVTHYLTDIVQKIIKEELWKTLASPRVVP
jgi:hypothetical protein